MTVFRALTKIAFNHLGYDVRRVAKPATVHIVEPGSDPVTYEYSRETRGYAVFEVEIADTRAFHALALPLRPEAHPFVRSIDIARHETSEKLAKAKIQEILLSYYEDVRPSSAADVFDIAREDLPGLHGFTPNSDDQPIDGDFLPWSGRGPTAIRRGREQTAVFEGIQNGVFSKVSDGITCFGPVTPAKLALEVNRLLRLLVSVRRRGFVRFDPRSPLQVGAFRRGDKYKWVINHGQHRFAVAAAFGIESVPAMVTEVVRRDDARFWPQVANGNFTERGALAIFDRIYEGTPASVCRRWIEKNLVYKGLNVAR